MDCMRGQPHRAATVAATFATACFAILSGCSSGTDGGPTTSATTPTGTPTEPPAAGSSGVSPGGVTTSVEALAESTEEEYFQACRAARLWMEQQSGDPETQIEPYLASIQASDAPSPGTFNTPWSQLAPARQSAVIVAVQAAADQACG